MQSHLPQSLAPAGPVATELPAGRADVLAARVPARGHLKPLDGIRGLAILMVICSHGFESNYESGGLFVRFMGELFYYGLFGVDLFFVLSGFLITGILFDSLGDDGFFRKFYMRRALRIFPLYYAVLIVCFLLTPVLHLQWHDMGWLLVLYLQNLHPATISQFSPGAGIGLYHFWSLAIEEQFYLVWPALVFFLRDRRAILRTTLAASVGALVLRLVLLAFHTSGLTLHVTTVCRADSLLLGGALAMLYRSQAWTYVVRLAPLGFLAATLVILASILGRARLEAHGQLSDFWVDGIRYTVLAVGFACLIAWALRPGSICQRIFQWGWLGFMGKYSYGIYVLHVFALSLLPFLRHAILQYTHSKLLSVALGGIGVLGVGIVAAYASYHLFEKRFLHLKHRFDYNRPVLNRSSPEDVDSSPSGTEIDPESATIGS
jgi:peptidoglycan/LPS O-acetylase OafA/YrhL